MQKLRLVAGITAALLGLGATAKADSTFFDIGLSANGGVATGANGFTNAAGRDFQVLSNITINSLGAFDSGQNGFAGTTKVAIVQFNLGSNPRGSTMANNGGTLASSDGTVVAQLSFNGSSTSTAGTFGSDSAFRFKPLVTPITLTPGYYELSWSGFSSSDPFYDPRTSPSLVTSYNFGGGATNLLRPDGTSATYNRAGSGGAPWGNRGDGPWGYVGGTFTYTATSSSTPEPGSLALIGAAIVGSSAISFRRRRKTR